ncbi:protein AF-10 [Xiphias gladius]|uniref:protein AF-10 n=1 Tax=Xiphias gladius TaxID=8245 RepID=UPI001A98DDC3|nr:protein AF-10 [Xiphias gladius]
MVSGERCLAADDEFSTSNMKEMIGGCCVCSDERGWAENPLVYCDGHGCNVAVHQACYGIVQVPTGPWFCRKCESQERAARVRCELCPHKDGALKRTDNGVYLKPSNWLSAKCLLQILGGTSKQQHAPSSHPYPPIHPALCPPPPVLLTRSKAGQGFNCWAHVVCALYIPEVEFANVSTMEPIVLQSVPHERYNKTCYICEDQGRESKAATGACMTCNKHGCRQAFHVTCAQFAGLLCEEQGSDADNVKYCGYCKYHHSKLRRSRGRGSRSQSLSDSSSQCMDRPPDKDKKVSSLPGSVFNLAPSHMFGNRLNPNSAMAALIAQSEASPADQEVGDGSSSVGAQGFPIRASPKTTPRSPIGGLQIRYDSSGLLPGPGLGLLGVGGSSGETLPPVATSIEQLLERQWNEGQSFLLQQGPQGDVVGMLKSLHQLQEENKRLEEQIKTLTMKKERLQLLSAQLSVPFTSTTASSDVKGAQLGAIDSSLPVAAQDSMSCGGHSSSGSTSSLSTPPSVSQSPPQPQLNGVATVGTTPTTLGGVAGLMGALGAGSALGMGGIVGALNGVIQTSTGTASPHTHTTGAATGVTLPVNNSAARLGLMSEQHRLLLQQHQLQQLLSSQPSAEQQQVLLYQLMQQQQDLQQLQSFSSPAQIPSIPLSSTQLPINNLLPGTQSQGTITANPFLALQHIHADTHTSGMQKPRLGEKVVGVAGQEKT